MRANLETREEAWFHNQTTTLWNLASQAFPYQCSSRCKAPPDFYLGIPWIDMMTNQSFVDGDVNVKVAGYGTEMLLATRRTPTPGLGFSTTSCCSNKKWAKNLSQMRRQVDIGKNVSSAYVVNPRHFQLMVLPCLGRHLPKEATSQYPVLSFQN